MKLLQLYLSAVFLTLLAYSAFVVNAHGWGKLPIFFEQLVSLTWSGQFNLDLAAMLGLSALWVAWKNRFSLAGLALAGATALFGILLLAPYVLILTVKNQTIRDVLLPSGN